MTTGRINQVTISHQQRTKATIRAIKLELWTLSLARYLTHKQTEVRIVVDEVS
jgi:hypothetical protein